MAPVTVWLLAAGGFLLGLLPCGWVVVRRGTMARLVALELSGTVAILALVALGQAFRQPSFMDLALVLTLLNFPAGLVFAHFLGLEKEE